MVVGLLVAILMALSVGSLVAGTTGRRQRAEDGNEERREEEKNVLEARGRHDSIRVHVITVSDWNICVARVLGCVMKGSGEVE